MAKEDTVTFTFTWPCPVSTFDGSEFNNHGIISPKFKTIHNNSGFEWTLFIYPAGYKAQDGTEVRKNISCWLRLAAGFPRNVKAAVSFFVECHGKLLNKWKDNANNNSMRIFSLGCVHRCLIGTTKFLPFGTDSLHSKGLIEDDHLKIVAVLEIPKSQFTWQDAVLKKENEVKENKDKLQLNFMGLFKDVTCEKADEEHDVTSNPSHTSDEDLNFKILTSDGKVVWCHRLVLNKKSSYFSTLLQAKSNESERNEADLNDVDAETILEVLYYIYTDKTSENFENLNIPKLLYAADQLLLPGLKLACERKLLNQLGSQNGVEMFIMADKYHLEHLREMSLNVASEDPLTIRKSGKRKKLSDDLWDEVLGTSVKWMRAAKLTPDFGLQI